MTDTCPGGSPDPHTFDYVILGAGLAGLSTGSVLGGKCVVLERESRPGGLARTECIDGHWFDHVLHLLHFQNDESEAELMSFLDGEFISCPPQAWVETSVGVTRYPIQMNLGSLDRESAVACIRDLAKVCYGPAGRKPENLHEALLCTFGQALCDLFMFPFNRKLWQHPLESLDPGVSWTTTVPRFEEALRGALSPGEGFKPYNHRGWYPVPPSNSFPRGMERLSRRFAAKVHNLRCDTAVTGVNLAGKAVSVVAGNGEKSIVRYRRGLVSSLPLPHFIAMIEDCPPEIAQSVKKLAWNRVYSLMLPVVCPLQQIGGHWRYYPDEDLCFTRLIDMKSFDPDMCPGDGNSLLVEIPERADRPVRPFSDVYGRAVRDLERAGVLSGNHKTLRGGMLVVDPAYVVFTPETSGIIDGVFDFLRSKGVEPIGRYGRWEYSSMAQVIHDGLTLGRSLI
jgi:protoporphyrinogen oxidase